MDQPLSIAEQKITRLETNNTKQPGVSTAITYIQHQQ